MRLGNGNESDSSAPTIRLATLIRGARTAAAACRASRAARRYIPIHYLLHTHWLHALECAEPNAAPSQSSRQPSLEGARANHDLTGLVTRQDDNHRPVEPGTPDIDRNHAARERDGYRVGTSAACSPIACTF